MKYLAAYTPPSAGGYPPYVNLSLTDDGAVQITVRDGSHGVVSSIVVSRATYEALVNEASGYLFDRGDLQALRKASP